MSEGALSALGAAAEQLANVDPRLAIAALVLHVTNHLLRSVAWRAVLAAAYPQVRVPLLTTAAAYASGVALNAVAPARGGDAVKVGLMRAALPGSTIATIAATMSVLVLFDVLLASVLVVVVGLAGVAPVDLVGLARGGVVAWVLGHATAALGLAVLLAAGAWVVWRVGRRRVTALAARLRQGGAILRTPVRYLRTVALVQVAAWCCRVGVVFCLLAAFQLPASVPMAGLVMVLCGASTVVPTPGGAGTQQVMVAFALSQTASAAAVVSFSVGMQAGVTAVNALLGVVAAMAVCRTLRPIAAVRGAMVAARGPS